MPWIYPTTTSITKSSLNKSLDHLVDPRSKRFGGSRQSSLLLHLSRSISMLPTERSTQDAQACDAAVRRQKRNRVRTLLSTQEGLRVVANTPAIAATKQALFSLRGELNRFL